MILVADTDVLIDFLRGKGEAERIAAELKVGGLATTAVTSFELWAGARIPAEVARIEILLEALKVIVLDKESARKAADVRRTLEAKGETIGMADSLIAGVCLYHGATLITRNRKHFKRVEGLRLSFSPNDVS